MNTIDSLKWRYATKKMNGKNIPDKKLTNILESIRLAPSSYGLTPYNVLVIKDKETKEKLLPACYNQSQIVDCSELLIFATWTDITEDDITEYMHDISIQREIPIESMNGFADMLRNSILPMTIEQKQLWASKQTYIALGVGMVAAASEKVDSTPMEGFSKESVDGILNLKDMGLSSSVILTLGYRDEKNDYLAPLTKVRREFERLFVEI